MTCYSPIGAWLNHDKTTANGKKVISFDKRELKPTKSREPIHLPCGQCIGCRLDYSKQWATRCHHEASLHDQNCFLTLTYNEESLPRDNSLKKQVMQNFMKKFRKLIYPIKIRYFLAGEYGELNGRPHYHLLIFGYDFNDKILHSSNDGNPLYISETLQNLWPKGYSSIANVTWESCAYVARYVTKKINNNKPTIDRNGYKHPSKQQHYGKRIPEFALMSRRPGIGKEWYEKFKDSVYPDDHVVISSDRILKPPKYYDNQLELTDPDLHATIKHDRKKSACQSPDSQPRTFYPRLKVKQKIQEAKASQLERKLQT